MEYQLSETTKGILKRREEKENGIGYGIGQSIRKGIMGAKEKIKEKRLEKQSSSLGNSLAHRVKSNLARNSKSPVYSGGIFANSDVSNKRENNIYFGGSKTSSNSDHIYFGRSINPTQPKKKSRSITIRL